MVLWQTSRLPEQETRLRLSVGLSSSSCATRVRLLHTAHPSHTAQPCHKYFILGRVQVLEQKAYMEPQISHNAQAKYGWMPCGSYLTHCILSSASLLNDRASRSCIQCLSVVLQQENMYRWPQSPAPSLGLPIYSLLVRTLTWITWDQVRCLSCSFF